MPGRRKAAYLLIFRANALLSAAGSVAIRGEQPRVFGRRRGTETGCAHRGRLYFIYLFSLIACSGLKTRRSTDSSGWQLPHFTFLTEIGRSGRDLPQCREQSAHHAWSAPPPARRSRPSCALPAAPTGTTSSCPPRLGRWEREGTSLFYRGEPQPPEGIEEGGSGEGKRLDTERKGRHRVHPSAQSVQTRIFTDIYRYIQRGSISIPLRPFFSFGNRSPSVRHVLPTTPRTPIHPSLHPYTPAGGQALLRGDGRGSGGHSRAPPHRDSPGCPGSSPSCQAEQAQPPGRAGSGGAGLNKAARSGAEPRPLPRRRQR